MRSRVSAAAGVADVAEASNSWQSVGEDWDMRFQGSALPLPIPQQRESPASQGFGEGARQTLH